MVKLESANAQTWRPVTIGIGSCLSISGRRASHHDLTLPKSARPLTKHKMASVTKSPTRSVMNVKVTAKRPSTVPSIPTLTFTRNDVTDSLPSSRRAGESCQDSPPLVDNEVTQKVAEFLL